MINLLNTRKNLAILALLVSMAPGAIPLRAEDGRPGWTKRLWQASLAAIAVSSALDIQSSLGKHETNGLLANRQGVFSSQSVALKLAIAGAAVGTQQFLLHRHPAPSAYKAGAIMNFAVAGALAGSAIHNYGVSPAH